MNSPANSGDPWKAKFLQLTHDLEAQREDAGVTEKQLYRIILRLSMASMGLDPALDPYFKQIRDLVRKGIHSKNLSTQLDNLTEILMRAESKPLAEMPRQLFHFLKEWAASPEERKGLENLEKRHEAGEFADSKVLFAAIRTALAKRNAAETAEPAAAARGGFMTRLFGNRNGTEAAPAVDLDRLRDRLLALLDNLEVPANAAREVNKFRQRLMSSFHEDGLDVSLNNLVNLVYEIRVCLEREHQEIEEFLTQLNGKLAELDQQTSGITQIATASAQSGLSMSHAFSGQVEELKTSTRDANDLAQLKSLVHSRLETITGQLKTYRATQENHFTELTEQVQALTSHVLNMELEATELRGKLNVAHNQTLRDRLTGIPNRAAYEERVQQDFQRWKRFGEPLTLLVWDIDHFKNINDRFGHLAGDKVLATVGRILAEGVRETDFAARYGGEEFTMLLNGADLPGALKLAEQLCNKIRACNVDFEGTHIPLSISCGISQFKAGDTPETAFARADHALYQAKEGGRDRCVAA
ncbi:MAG TPA: GGDEF domain-containing protein [Methylococcaceae bacterium]|nr:GGDEF domain-containing protein [Methylococcaceae bacterium]